MQPPQVRQTRSGPGCSTNVTVVRTRPAVDGQFVRLSAGQRRPERRSNAGHPIWEASRTSLELGSDLEFRVELWGFEPQTSCMPCLAISYGHVVLGPIPGRQAGSSVWLPLALSGTV